MGRRKTLPKTLKRTPTTVELEFLEVVWGQGEVSAEDVQRALARRGRRLTDGSVRKVLQILVDKGQVHRRREGRVFLYQASAPPGQTRARIVGDVVERVFRGSAPRLVASLFESRTISTSELDEIKALIAAHEQERRR